MFLNIEPAQEPLPDKEWHRHLEVFLNTGNVNPDILQFLDYKQMYLINEIKKAAKRVKYKENAREIKEDSE